MQHRTGRVLLLVSVVVGGVVVARAPAADIARLRVEGGALDLGATPLLRVLPRVEPTLAAGEYRLVPEEGGPPLAATVLGAEGGPVLGFVLDGLKAGQSRGFRVERQAGIAGAGGVAFTRESDGALRVSSGGSLFTVLRSGQSKPFFHPVVGPSGDSHTRAYPMEDREGEDRDHPHQRSFWITHGDVNGVDFWASDPLNKPSPRFGTITQQAVLSHDGRAFGRLVTTNLWVDSDAQPVCEDQRVFTFWQLPEARIIDVDVTFRASWGPVTFGDTKEGTFGLRVASGWDVTRGKGGRIVNAEGRTDQAAWGKPSPWVDYSGPLGERTAGIAILNHPDSFRHPTTWHVRDYGLFAANPFGYHDFGVGRPGAHTLAAGSELRLRYRVLLHPGDAASAGVAAAYNGYARPPAVVLLPH